MSITSIKNFLITGDCHGKFAERFESIKRMGYDSEDTALIILGDAGWNFYLKRSDFRKKWNFHDRYNFIVYCVRGNHEERPEKIDGVFRIWDENVKGAVYIERGFPRIRYFIDGNIYIINGLKTLVVGGAYSVDKWHRLNGNPENTTEWTGWFADEQLSEREKELIRETNKKHKVNLILSHTCPTSVIPTDLFLPMIDQSTVDNSMEDFLEEIYQSYKDKNVPEDMPVWLFGHYHDDRIEQFKVEQFYKEIENLNDILKRWNEFDDARLKS